MHHLLPLVERWGLGDDSERDLAIEQANTDELKKLVKSVTDSDAEELEKWLTGPEASKPPFTDEYDSFTCFLMAYDYARSVLNDR